MVKPLMGTENLLSQQIQNSFVKLAIANKKFLKLIRDSVKIEFFDSEITRRIVELCFAYYDVYDDAPQNHFYDEVELLLDDVDDSELQLYLDYLKQLEELAEPKFEYIITKINDFITAKAYELGSEKFVEAIEHNKLSEAKQIMEDALKVGICLDASGINYNESVIPSYHTKEGTLDILMKTGIKHFDDLIDGYRRKWLVCFLGGYKGKKSWKLIHVGRWALLQGLNVVHFTHELSEEDIEMRYDMAFGALTSKATPIPVTYKRYDEIGREISTEEIIRGTVRDLEAVQPVKLMTRRFGGGIRIKKYPMGSASMSDLNRYLDYLEMVEDFKADVIINDYVDIMHLSGPYNAQLRDKLSQTYIEHKRLADERNAAVFTVSQGTRQATRKQKLSMVDFAEDIRKVAHIDLGVGLCETDDEAESSIMRLRIIAGRSVPMDKEFCVSSNITVGQFAMQSWLSEEDVEY